MDDPAAPGRVSGPIEPPHCRWELPDPRQADSAGVVAVDADLDPGTVLAAYRAGMFPMPVRWSRSVAWWSPDPRGVIPLDGLKVSRSLRKACARFEVRIDTAFDQVLDACGDPRRPNGWINKAVKSAYRTLHELGWAHSVEAWTPDGELAGGLYGLAIGGLFAGESMFHRATDASKVALVHLVELLTAAAPGAGGRLLDIQWVTPHLASLGAVELRRPAYLDRLAAALPLPDAFTP